jgi:hypothetical protein
VESNNLGWEINSEGGNEAKKVSMYALKSKE